jgi:hypothetical protein
MRFNAVNESKTQSTKRSQQTKSTNAVRNAVNVTLKVKPKKTMPAPGRSYRRLPDTVRHRIEVAAAMAWEALVESHAAQAREFVALMDDAMPLEEALNRYVGDMDLSDTMVSAVRTRVLVAIEDAQVSKSVESLTLRPDPVDNGADAAVEDDDGWRRFRPDVVMRGVIERQKKNEEVERLVELAIARAEEAIIQTHIDNAITFAALLDEFGPLSRGVEHYIAVMNIVGGRAQAVLQRTMARLADVHLPAPRYSAGEALG